MKRRSAWLCGWYAAPVLVLLSALICTAQHPVSLAPIRESDITSLEADLTTQLSGTSAVAMRLACKDVIRRGKEILEANPSAPNRFRLLEVIFQTQKRLYGLESSDRNRGDLFETCEVLAQAPDEYAALRLEADLLLSERDLAAMDASLQERAQALRAIVDRYRGTPAEAKSLMMAAMIAPKLEATELEDEIFEVLNERFADDPSVIEFIQKNLGVRRLDVLFTGAFTRVDGTVIRFPNDRMGHLCILVFWSRQSPGFEKYLKQVQEHQTLHPDRSDVFSFNLDELPDAGESILRDMGLDWAAMRLPDGRKSQTYRTYVQRDPLGLLVNAVGHVVLLPAVVRHDAFKLDDARISCERYLAQLQSLFAGDFLVTDSAGSFDPAAPPELKMISTGEDTQSPLGLKRTDQSVPEDSLRAIQNCLILPPHRYRLTTAQALANYTKAEELCRDALERHSQAPDLWVVRNRRIVSLMGMWNLTGEPKYLDQAVKESRAALIVDIPPAAGVVPRFCLAKQALREIGAKPESVLTALILESGADLAPASAHAAAAMLAIDAQSKELHERYREPFMKASYDGNPALWSFVSFLRDRYHRYHLFKGNMVRSEDRGVRGYIVNHGSAASTDRMPELELWTPDGKTLSIPKDTNGKLTLLIFIEPPDVIPGAIELDTNGKAKKRQPLSFVVDRATQLAKRHVNMELDVVIASLCDDPGKINAMMEAEGWIGQAAIVPGGLANPMVRRLGIYSADRLPNVFLLRRDGTIQWRNSGYRFKAEFGQDFAIYLAMKVHTEVCDVEAGYEALQRSDLTRAVRIFSGPFLPEKDERFQWAGPRAHGRALASMGLKQWGAALADIDIAIKAHHNSDARTGPCDVMAEMRLIRADILDQLARSDEARAERQIAAAPTATHTVSPYSLFQARLTALRRGDH